MKNKQNPQYPLVRLTNDRIFKHYFSRDRDVLLSLLKTFLPLPKKKSVQDVEIISNQKPESKKAKKEPRSIQAKSLILKDSVFSF